MPTRDIPVKTTEDLPSIEAIRALGPKHPAIQGVVDWFGLHRREIAIHNALQRFAGKNNWGDGADGKSGIFPAIETLQRLSGYKAHNDAEAALRTLENSGLWSCHQVKDSTGKFQRNRYVFSAARIFELARMREAGLEPPTVARVKRKQYGPTLRHTPAEPSPHPHCGDTAISAESASPKPQIVATAKTPQKPPSRSHKNRLAEAANCVEPKPQIVSQPKPQIVACNLLVGTSKRISNNNLSENSTLEKSTEEMFSNEEEFADEEKVEDDSLDLDSGEAKREPEHAQAQSPRDAGKCEHEDAVLSDEHRGWFVCPRCAGYISIETGEEQSEPPPRKRYFRDEKLMVETACSAPGCPNTWKIWPQNKSTNLLCPQMHGPLEKYAQTRAKQKEFRAKQFPASGRSRTSSLRAP